MNGRRGGDDKVIFEDSPPLQFERKKKKDGKYSLLAEG